MGYAFTATAESGDRISPLPGAEQFLSDTTAVPLIVHSATRDAGRGAQQPAAPCRHGCALHLDLRAAGHPRRARAAQSRTADLLPARGRRASRELAAMRDQMAGTVPLIAVREQVDEDVIAADMAQGARDTVSLQQPGRLQAVIARELRAFRLERTLHSARCARRRTIAASSKRSCSAPTMRSRRSRKASWWTRTRAWLELFGVAEATGLVGQPVMDLFEEATQAPLKAALTACLQGRWSNHTLKAGAVLGDGSVVPLELVLALGEYEGEPGVRLIVPAHKRDDRQLAHELESAVHSDPGTGTADAPASAGCAAGAAASSRSPAACATSPACAPTSSPRSSATSACSASEQFLIAFANIVRSLLGPHDIAGHFGGTSLLLLLERGNRATSRPGARTLIERVAKHVFTAARHRRAARDLHASASDGLRSPSPTSMPPALDALDATARGRERGGNQVVAIDRADNGHARAGLRPGLGQAHQGRADGEPLPAGAAADRGAERRQRRRCSTSRSACSMPRARKCCPRSSCRPPPATS